MIVFVNIKKDYLFSVSQRQMAAITINLPSPASFFDTPLEGEKDGRGTKGRYGEWDRLLSFSYLNQFLLLVRGRVVDLSVWKHPGCKGL